MEYEESDLKVFDGFVHRTFQEVDAKGFVRALAGLLRTHGSLEQAVMSGWETPEDPECLASALTSFHCAFMAQEGVAPRTQKHVANPAKGSAAKRLNMWLRWMVRPSNRGVDLGLWKGISPSVLHIPLDVHTSNVGRKLGLLTRTANDWKAVAELTASLFRHCAWQRGRRLKAGGGAEVGPENVQAGAVAKRPEATHAESVESLGATAVTGSAV